MENDYQEQALGRANAACCALFALYERFEGDVQLASFLAQHAEMGRAALLNTTTPDIAIQEFDRTIKELQHRMTRAR